MCLLHKKWKKKKTYKGAWENIATQNKTKPNPKKHTTPTSPLSSEFERPSLQEISIFFSDTNFICNTIALCKHMNNYDNYVSINYKNTLQRWSTVSIFQRENCISQKLFITKNNIIAFQLLIVLVNTWKKHSGD